MWQWILVFTALLAFVLTGLVYRYASHYRLLDIPNSRSSHVRPTPSGGGLAIVVAVVVGAGLLVWQSMLPVDILYLLGPGILLALLGLLDDRFQLASGWRLLGQIGVACIVLWLLKGVPWLTLPGLNIQAYYIAEILLLLFFVWYLNLYNFMDGINGIASLQAISVCLGALLLIATTMTLEKELALFISLLLVACLGFLPWNFPQAKIFMGDAGSLFCGYFLVLAMLLSGWLKPSLFWALLILSGYFITDATFTLLHRLLRRQRVWEAHRLHAYQKLARRWNSHARVSCMVIMINLGGLLPVAWLVASESIPAIAGAVLAYLPLVLLVWRAGAGKTT